MINTSSHQQHREGFWWADLIPAAIDRTLLRFPSIDRFESFFQQTGFVGIEVVVPLAEVLQGEQYLDPAGPLSAAWRAGDSTWSLTTEEELSRALDNVTCQFRSVGATDAVWPMSLRAVSFDGRPLRRTQSAASVVDLCTFQHLLDLFRGSACRAIILTTDDRWTCNRFTSVLLNETRRKGQ